MGEDKVYTASALPPREARTQAVPAPPTPAPASPLDFSGAGFAEIEIDAGTFSGNGAVAQPSYIPPSQRPTDPIRLRFATMRKLAPDNPYSRSDAGLFYKQAKFMEDFADDFPGAAPFSMYYPYYHHMGHDQLRTYFTWRTRVRGGDIAPTHISYVFLYFYELLANIGVTGPAEGLDQLMALWQTYRAHEPALDKYLPPWLRDYHVYYELPHTFAEFVRANSLLGYYPDLFLLEPGDALAAWRTLSTYDLGKSKFFQADNVALFAEAFEAVLAALRELCAAKGLAFADLLVYDVCKGLTWHPFQNALFFPWKDHPDRQLTLPGGDSYTCQNNRWQRNTCLAAPGRRELAGYLIKKIEACLRRAEKFKYHITADPATAHLALFQLQSHGITAALLETTIEDAIKQFYAERNRTVVQVDLGNLARIRQEALGTQEKLVIDDEPLLAPVVLPQPTAPAPTVASNPWTDLRSMLSETEKQALALLLADGDIKAFADECGVMLEVLADGINEKAADLVGDSLLEVTDTMAIYDDYRDQIASLLE